jgi:hypothetical protein
MNTQTICPSAIILGAALLAAPLIGHAAYADVSPPITAVSFPKEVLPFPNTTAALPGIMSPEVQTDE